MAEDFQKILSDLEKEALYQNIEIISRQKGEFLGELVQKNQPQNILEIGTGIGYAALFLASGLGTVGKLYTCDSHFDYLQIANQTFERAELTDKIKVLPGDVFETLPKVNKKFDLVFLDGARNDYFKYLHLLEGKLAPEAIIVANSAGIYKDQMANYLEEVRNSGQYHSEFHKFGEDGMEVSIKK